MVINPALLRADARRNYDLLVTTATSMLALPNSNFSFNELAKRAGVGIGTLYRHFPTKQMLLEVIYTDKIAALDTKVFTKLPADKALEEWLQKLIHFSMHSPGFEIFINETLKETKSPILTSGSDLLKAAQKANLLRSDVGVRDLLGLIEGIVSVAKEAKQVNTMLSVVMTGLKK